jgi:type IV pilus assembly protein PilC
VLWWLVRLAGYEPVLVEMLVLPLPVVGRVMRANLLARWCDALKLGVEAGLDLPAALSLTGDAVDTPGLREDTRQLVALVEGGKPLDALHTRRLMPATVTAAIDLSAQRGALPATLESLARMYQEQAELRLGTLQAFLTPVLLCGLAVVIGYIVLSLFLPLVKLMQSVAG